MQSSMIEAIQDDDAGGVSWDAFLESQSFGAYQQSSMWARAKAQEEWQVERVILSAAGVIKGGFQILWRETRVGRIGYVSRGPVIAGSDQVSVDALVDALIEAGHQLRCQALVVQCPNGVAALDARLSERGFLPNRVRRIISATWLTPVREGIAVVEAGMRRSTRRTMRQSFKAGVTVQEGDVEDLETFFELMLESCLRQGTSPNPSSTERLRGVWKAFGGTKRCRLTLAMRDGRSVAGLFCLCFGKRVHVWKKGTLAEALSVHPMEPLYHDALEWAGRQGYEVCDFEAASRGTAETLLAGQPLTPDMMKSRDFYNMGFGGHPELLPEARIWFRNPVVRRMYRWTACSSLGSRLLRRFYVC